MLVAGFNVWKENETEIEEERVMIKWFFFQEKGQIVYDISTYNYKRMPV